MGTRLEVSFELALRLTSDKKYCARFFIDELGGTETLGAIVGGIETKVQGSVEYPLCASLGLAVSAFATGGLIEVIPMMGAVEYFGILG